MKHFAAREANYRAAYLASKTYRRARRREVFQLLGVIAGAMGLIWILLTAMLWAFEHLPIDYN